MQLSCPQGVIPAWPAALQDLSGYTLAADSPLPECMLLVEGLLFRPRRS